MVTNDESGDYTHAQVLTILTGLLLGMFLGALDQTIVSTSIRTIDQRSVRRFIGDEVSERVL